MRNFWIYMIGVLLLVGAVAYGADRLEVNEPWIWIGVVALLGLGLMAAVTKLRPPQS
jgi:hypothetical protein